MSPTRQDAKRRRTDRRGRPKTTGRAALIVKCDPPAVGFDLAFETEVRPSGDVAPTAGDEVFVWTAESARGQGLAMKGTLLGAKVSKVNRKASLRIHVDAAAPSGSLTFDELRPHRDAEGDAPLAKLARKLLRDATKKVAALDPDETRFLRALFATAKKG